MTKDLLVLSELVRTKFGLDFSEHLDRLSRKVALRLAATGCSTVGAYLSFLEHTVDTVHELNELANVVTNNETYFFREQMQLAVVCDEIVTEMLREQRHPGAIKILSVPSSTGEEPYSIAMNLLMSDQPVGSRVAIYGADISERAIELARVGRYRPMSFRGVAPEVLERFFQPSDELQAIKPQVQRLVEFFLANLVLPESLAYAAPYDIIFCRNVMIYFNQATQRQVIEILTSVLAPGGYLCLGHADASPGLYEHFDTRTLVGSVLYRRKKNAATIVTGA